MYFVINEDKQTDVIKRYIVNNVNPALVPYIKTKVSDLPDEMQKHLHDVSPSIYDSCIKNGNNLTGFFRLQFLNYFDMSHQKGPYEYVIGVARVAIEELGMFMNNNDADLSTLKNMILFVHSSKNNPYGIEVPEFNENLDGLSFDSLVERIRPIKRKFDAESRKSLSGKVNNNGKYKVIPIKSFEQASEYGKYTSWCVTHDRGNYDGYTKGGRRFYFCLRDGFENVPCKPTEGCPLDDYGLSMVSVLIDMEGDPTHVTTRWNHENNGENNENLHTAEQVQDVLGIDFFNTFKPYSREELKAMGIVSFDEAKERLEAGEDPEDIFDNVVYFTEDGITTVKLNNKYNFIDKSGKLLSDKWFNYVYDFQEGFAIVYLNNKYNFIDKSGKLLSDKWFDDADDFQEGFAIVYLNSKWNFIDKSGKLLSDKWFDDADDFHEGFAMVYLDNRCNLIDKSGKFLSDKWFDDVYGFKEGFARVYLDNRCNLIDKSGKFLSDKWFDYVRDFHEGFAKVYLDNRWNLIDKSGKLHSPNQ